MGADHVSPLKPPVFLSTKYQEVGQDGEEDKHIARHH